MTTQDNTGTYRILEGWELAAHKLTKPHYFDPDANPPRVIRRLFEISKNGPGGGHVYHAWFASDIEGQDWVDAMTILVRRENDK